MLHPFDDRPRWIIKLSSLFNSLRSDFDERIASIKPSTLNTIFSVALVIGAWGGLAFHWPEAAWGIAAGLFFFFAISALICSIILGVKEDDAPNEMGFELGQAFTVFLLCLIIGFAFTRLL